MLRSTVFIIFFFFNDTATTEIYTLSLHDALPICCRMGQLLSLLRQLLRLDDPVARLPADEARVPEQRAVEAEQRGEDRKSTRLNSSHANISYAVFCLKKKKKNDNSVTYDSAPIAL